LNVHRHRIPQTIAATALMLAGAAGCKSTIGQSGPIGGAEQSSQASQAAPPAAGGSCHARPGPLPDANCTPGVTNPKVTQDSIATTICASGWTSTIRPRTSITDQLKKQQIAAYGYTDTNSRDYEEDHLISLELGGSPDDPKNLWPEPGASPNAKDKVENALNKAVCSGKVPLAAAQHAIATDWMTAESSLGIG
jgi:hypothetical protein